MQQAWLQNLTACYSWGKKKYKSHFLERAAPVNTLQHVLDILSVFRGITPHRGQRVPEPGISKLYCIFFVDIKEKYMLNRSKQSLITHAQFSAFILSSF